MTPGMLPDDPGPIPPATAIAGRSVHRWLVGVPVLLFIATLTGFALFASEHDGDWLRAAFLTNLAAVGAAAIVAAFGVLDFQRIPKGHRAIPFAAAHGALNTGSLLLFVANLVTHRHALEDATRDRMHDDYRFDPTTSLALIGTAVALTVVSGAIGFYMAHKLRVGEVPMLRSPGATSGPRPAPARTGGGV